MRLYETKLHHELLPRITPGDETCALSSSVGDVDSNGSGGAGGGCGGAQAITTLDDALRRIAQLEAELRVCRRAIRLAHVTPPPDAAVVTTPPYAFSDV